MVVIFITCKNRKEATNIAKLLLAEKLVACVKITSGVHSMYLWPPKSDKVEVSGEVLLICETLEEKWSQLEKEVMKLSSYDTPSIIALPASHVSQKYLNWLKGEII